MSKKTKKILIYILLAFGLIVLISLSGKIYRFIKKSAEPVTDNLPVTITYWGLFQPEAVMKPLIEKYQKENPNVTIIYEERKFERDISEYKKNLKTRLENGSGPTIYRVHSTWIPEFIYEISWANKSITLEEFNSRFYPVAYSQCVGTGGEILCIPIMYDGLVLLYNVEMFNDSGLTPPKTWEDVKYTSGKLKVNNDKDETVRAGVALGTVSNVANSSDILALMMEQSGVSIPDDLDSQKAEEVVNYYKSFVDSGGWNNNMNYSNTAFATEEVAMVFAKRWEILEILSLNPTLNFGVLEVPQLPKLDGSTTSKAWASFYVETVSDNVSEKEQRIAWDFLDWLSQPEQQAMLFEESSRYSKFGEVYSDKTMSDKIINSPILGPFAKQAQYAQTGLVSATSGNDEYAKLIDQLVEGNSNRRDREDIYTYVKTEYLRLLER